MPSKPKRTKPRNGTGIVINSNHGLPKEVVKAIKDLPQVKSKMWSASQLATEVWRDRLGMPMSCTKEDLDKIFNGEIV